MQDNRMPEDGDTDMVKQALEVNTPSIAYSQKASSVTENILFPTDELVIEYDHADIKRLEPVVEKSTIPSRKDFLPYYRCVEKLLGAQRVREQISVTYPDSHTQAQKMKELENQIKATAITLFAADAKKRGQDFSDDPFLKESCREGEAERQVLLGRFKSEEALLAYQEFERAVSLFDPLTGEGRIKLIEAMERVEQYFNDIPLDVRFSMLSTMLRVVLLIIVSHPREIFQAFQDGSLQKSMLVLSERPSSKNGTTPEDRGTFIRSGQDTIPHEDVYQTYEVYTHAESEVS